MISSASHTYIYLYIYRKHTYDYVPIEYTYFSQICAPDHIEKAMLFWVLLSSTASKNVLMMVIYSLNNSELRDKRQTRTCKTLPAIEKKKATNHKHQPEDEDLKITAKATVSRNKVIQRFEKLLTI